MTYISTANVLLAGHGTQYQDLSREEKHGIAAASQCGFIPVNGGYLRGCYELATKVVGIYKEKRCDRHADIDERTHRNRNRRYGWSNPFVCTPYDARIAMAQAIDTIFGAREFTRISHIEEATAKAATYLLLHVEATDEQRRFLNRVAGRKVAVK